MESIALLKPMILRRTQDTFELSNRVVIEIHTANFRAIRVYTIAAAFCDQIAFWRSEESANPDFEILNGLHPGMATISNSLLLCISSPHARRGVLYDASQKHHGKDSGVIVWQAATRDMNPNVKQEIIDKALEEDEAAARAEWLAEFRRDVESYVSRDAIEEAKIPHRLELSYSIQFRFYAFVDPSGGPVPVGGRLSITHHTATTMSPTPQPEPAS